MKSIKKSHFQFTGYFKLTLDNCRFEFFEVTLGKNN